jgi:hypothetical protein
MIMHTFVSTPTVSKDSKTKELWEIQAQAIPLLQKALLSPLIDTKILELLTELERQKKGHRTNIPLEYIWNESQVRQVLTNMKALHVLWTSQVWWEEDIIYLNHELTWKLRAKAIQDVQKTISWLIWEKIPTENTTIQAKILMLRQLWVTRKDIDNLLTK